ncbi:MAG: transcription antitermination factor NusB [Alphaproteobacteria bacterium]|nr:transcription antitermination factor NusB [Alphaproteobacteria bacterium]
MPRTRNSNSITRLVLVQSLYQMEIAGTDVNEIINSLNSRIIFDSSEDKLINDINKSLFSNLINEIVEKQITIDNEIKKFLSDDWDFNRLDKILIAILRSAFYEIIFQSNTPYKVIIDEYVEISHSFFSGKEPNFTNAILDKLSEAHRK